MPVLFLLGRPHADIGLPISRGDIALRFAVLPIVTKWPMCQMSQLWQLWQMWQVWQV
jgi:hypothetical protein